MTVKGSHGLERSGRLTLFSDRCLDFLSQMCLLDYRVFSWSTVSGPGPLLVVDWCLFVFLVPVEMPTIFFFFFFFYLHAGVRGDGFRFMRVTLRAEKYVRKKWVQKLWVRKDCVSFWVGDDVPLHWSPLLSTWAHAYTHTCIHALFHCLCNNGLCAKFITVWEVSHDGFYNKGFQLESSQGWCSYEVWVLLSDSKR